MTEATTPSLRLTLAGARLILDAAVAKAAAMGVPQCVAVVDPGGHLLAFNRMDGALWMSFDSAQAKARTSASTGKPTGLMPPGVDDKLAMATRGQRINLPGGLPIIVDGCVLGGIGIGSGTGEEDRQVACAGVAALAGATRFD
jgi:glc operon protein GlcG